MHCELSEQVDPHYFSYGWELLFQQAGDWHDQILPPLPEVSTHTSPILAAGAD
ncbi:hypothetical protein ACIBCH_33060 [Amycolatopsis thailandensis]|uniref:hypothetical protein n=1 Tax=Amycolatopsis thailandensis TaxID=589330 RepID=UPI0037B089B2